MKKKIIVYFVFLLIFFSINISYAEENTGQKNKKENIINLLKNKKDPQSLNDSLQTFDITNKESDLDKVRAVPTEGIEFNGSRHPPQKEFLEPYEGGSSKFSSKQIQDLLNPVGESEISLDTIQKLLNHDMDEEIENQVEGLPSKDSHAVNSDAQKEESDEGKFSLAPKKPMVLDLGNGEFIVDQDFESNIPLLLDMNKLAYALGKVNTFGEDYNKAIQKLSRVLQEKGWEIIPFEGKTGKDNHKNDVPGFVAYNRKSNIMTVIMRGSQTREDETKSADWEVNFDAEIINTSFGKAHRGFYKRSIAALPNIQLAMNSFFDQMDNAEKRNVKIMISGHSQGAALASLIMPFLIEHYKKKGTFGPKFNNATDNIFQGYFISAPRVYSGQKSLDWVHDIAGKHNMIRQNVTGRFIADPVPIASPGKTLTALMSLIPFVGEKLAKKYGGDKEGTRSVGYLAADWTSKVLSRNVDFNALTRTGKRAITFFWKRWDSLAYLAQNPLIFLKKDTRIDLFNRLVKEPLADLMILLGPLHYGSPKDQVADDVLFSQTTLDKTSMAKLLQQGFQKKASERKGLSGLVRGGIEKAAEIKASLPQLAAVAAGIAVTVRKAPNIIKRGLKGAFKAFKRKLWWRK